MVSQITMAACDQPDVHWISAMTVSVRVIDGTYGRPATGVSVRLDRDIEGSWTEQKWDVTDEEGNIAKLCDAQFTRGVYRLEFDLDSYFSSMGVTPFYPVVTMKFRIADPGQNHHISLLITPSAYCTYRYQ
jgi:5-hydroxyisourate hydrolase